MKWQRPSWPRGRPAEGRLVLSLLALFGFTLSAISSCELLAPKAWATEQIVNNCQSTLNGGITSGATTLVVTSASCFPTTGTFTILIDQEGMTVTGVSGTTFTVTRTEFGTNASHSSGVAVTALESTRAFKQIETDATFPALSGMYPSL